MQPANPMSLMPTCDSLVTQKFHFVECFPPSHLPKCSSMSKHRPRGPKLSFYIPEDDDPSYCHPTPNPTNNFSTSRFREGQHGYLGSSTSYIAAGASPSKRRNPEVPSSIDWNDEPEPDHPWLDPAYVHHLDDISATPRQRTVSVSIKLSHLLFNHLTHGCQRMIRWTTG